MVRPKKRLGQHFLNDEGIANDIVDSLGRHNGYEKLLEIGPGTGVLSFLLLKKKEFDPVFMELDRESIEFLKANMDHEKDRVIHQDFLKADLNEVMQGAKFGIIGNFPYNISSQIFFKILNHKDQVQEVVCMLQKEVGDRIAAKHGSRTYGILSVLLQAFYSIETMFAVTPDRFIPPPRVMSTVIRLQRNERRDLPCSFDYFLKVVKQGFQNRRKTLRNALKPINLPNKLSEDPRLSLRAEQLSVDEFIDLATRIEECQNS